MSKKFLALLMYFKNIVVVRLYISKLCSKFSLFHKRQVLGCGALFLMASAGNMNVHTHDQETVVRVPSITQDQLRQLHDELSAQLKTLQTGLQAWSWTPQVAFSLTAKNVYNCSDRDIAIFPFAQGMWYVTHEEFIKLVCIDRLNKRWEAIRTLVRDVHDVRYQLHLIVCKDLAISNVECGNTGYKQIESYIKADKAYETRYKQYVTDGLIISYLYEMGLLR